MYKAKNLKGYVLLKTKSPRKFSTVEDVTHISLVLCLRNIY